MRRDIYARLGLTASTLLLQSKTHRLQRTNRPGGAPQSHWRGKREHKAEEIGGLRGLRCIKKTEMEGYTSNNSTVEEWTHFQPAEIYFCDCELVCFLRRHFAVARLSGAHRPVGLYTYAVIYVIIPSSTVPFLLKPTHAVSCTYSVYHRIE